MSDTLSGGCLCGGVQYEISGEPSGMAHCHCTRCQRAGGAAHGTVLIVKPEDYRVVQGQDLLRKYNEEGFTARVSCSQCGSSLYHGEVFVEAGTLTVDPGMRPSMHIMVDHKASWHEITDSLPQHGEWPPS